MNASSVITPLRDFSDRLSPMVVKELRHGLRTRMFASMLTTFQLCMILIVGSGVLGVPAEVMGNIFWSIALIALLLALPVRGFGALSGEMLGGTMDMLTLTSISSFRIVWGKWTALFSQSLLVAVSLLPYMVARYYFGGVEIVREGVALFLAVLASAITSAAFVAFSSQKSIILRLFLAAGILSSLIPVTVFIFVMINESGGDQVLSEFLTLSPPEQIGIAAGLPFLVIYGIFALLALGASRIAPASENHSTWKRLTHLVMLSLLTVSGWMLAFHPSDQAVVWALIPAMLLTVIVGMDVMTEEMPRFPTVVHGFVRRGGLMPWLGRAFYPGWSSGVIFYLLLMTMTFSMIVAAAANHRWSDILIPFCLVFCILSSPTVPVWIRINRNNLFANWWVVHLILAAAGILIMMLSALSGAPEGVLALGALGGGCSACAALALARQESEVYTDLENDARHLDKKETASTRNVS